MQVTVHSSDFFLSEALRSQSEERVRAAMSCYESLVQQIVMWQSGTNGPRKRCHLRVTLTRSPDVVVEHAEASLNLAIDRATDRVKTILISKIDCREVLQGHDSPPALFRQSDTSDLAGS